MRFICIKVGIPSLGYALLLSLRVEGSVELSTRENSWTRETRLEQNILDERHSCGFHPDPLEPCETVVTAKRILGNDDDGSNPRPIAIPLPQEGVRVLSFLSYHMRGPVPSIRVPVRPQFFPIF